MHIKKIFTLVLLVNVYILGIVLVPSEVQAEVQEKFPLQIEDYTLSTPFAWFDSHCGHIFCYETWWAQYLGPKNKQVSVYMTNFSKGIHSHEQDLAFAKKTKLDSNRVYTTEEGEITWLLLNQAKEDGFKFNTFSTLETNTVKKNYGLEYVADRNATGNNPVTKYFIKKYPADPKKLKKSYTRSAKKDMKLEIVSPKKGEELIAGNQYEIKWESKNLSDYLDIFFQFEYRGEEVSLESSIPNTGSYLWNVPVEFALSKTEYAPYRLRVILSDYGVDVEDYSDEFYILHGNSKEVYPITLDNYTKDEIWKRGTSQTIQWRELNSVTSYTVSLIKEGEEKGKIIRKTKANFHPFVQDPTWRIDRKTKPGKYYWKIEGFNKNKLVAETKSDIFEIIE